MIDSCSIELTLLTVVVLR